MRLEYGCIEKYEKSLHGRVKNALMNRYFDTKDRYLYFELKNKKQSLEDFHEENQFSDRTIKLIQIFSFGGYFLAKDREDIIIRIQKIYRNWICNKRKKYNIKYLYNRQIGYNLNKKNIYN